MNKIFSGILLVVAFAITGLAQTPCTRYVAADFSICQPAGWTATAETGSAFKTISGPASNGKMANLIFREVLDSLKLGEYVDGENGYTLKHVAELGFTNLKLSSRSAFVTDTNETGIKSTFLEELEGSKLFGAQYIFDTGKKKLIVTFTSFESERTPNEKSFDDTVKTLKVNH